MEDRMLVEFIFIMIAFVIAFIIMKFYLEEDMHMKIFLLLFSFFILVFSLTNLLSEFWQTIPIFIIAYIIYTLTRREKE
ncbi:MAG: hypothetical protein ACTSO2_13755 [Promethearchaeota archaeon]